MIVQNIIQLNVIKNQDSNSKILKKELNMEAEVLIINYFLYIIYFTAYLCISTFHLNI